MTPVAEVLTKFKELGEAPIGYARLIRVESTQGGGPVSAGVGMPHHWNDLPSPHGERLLGYSESMADGWFCATKPHQFDQWFPEHALIEVLDKGLKVLAIDVPVSAARIGHHQAIYRKEEATTVAVLA